MAKKLTDAEKARRKARIKRNLDIMDKSRPGRKSASRLTEETTKHGRSDREETEEIYGIPRGGLVSRKRSKKKKSRSKRA